jgi:hypothetical protein
VDWQTHGLKDYPKVIKHPMDLGTVATRLKMREYKHPKVRARAQARGQRCAQRRIARRGERARLGGACDLRACAAPQPVRPPPRIPRARQEFKHDVNLVWNNCMTYNVEGSPYYLVAQKLKQIFEERYAKTVRDEGASSSVADKEGRGRVAAVAAAAAATESAEIARLRPRRRACSPPPASLTPPLRRRGRGSVARARADGQEDLFAEHLQHQQRRPRPRRAHPGPAVRRVHQED